GRIQKISGANLSRNWVMIPHVTHFDKTDITDLEAFRKQQNAEVIKASHSILSALTTRFLSSLIHLLVVVICMMSYSDPLLKITSP
ncbi:2-oxo acid dehydrogenase subunit E2, partial [Salmonella enterica subsp. enterica serovar Kentucky]|nr:2-oxo acid dehydrogenase subunit E2 [Salmonella enterica subsp. enterica serovar Kentucky]